MASSNFLGMISSHYKWTVPIVVSMVAFFGRLFFRLYKIEKPGPYFSVMFVSIGASSNIEFSQIPMMSLFFIIGIIVSIVLAVIFTFFDKQPIEIYRIEPLKTRLISDPSVILDSYLYATILFFATYISFSLSLYNPYWLVVSCAAILQGNKLKDAYTRHIQRIIGTIIGLLLAAVLLEINLSILDQMLVISILYMVVDFFKKKNYTFLLFFSTPMALMLSNLVHHQYITTLIQYRFICIILGSLIGLFWVWLITITLKFYIKNVHFIDHIKKNKL
ncbi:FUSC family protein [Enterococcus faecalis]|nr:FUSC family protein [Enterococcus faecalis]